MFKGDLLLNSIEWWGICIIPEFSADGGRLVKKKKKKRSADNQTITAESIKENQETENSNNGRPSEKILKHYKQLFVCLGQLPPPLP